MKMAKRNVGGLMMTAIFNNAKRLGNTRAGLSIEALAEVAGISVKDAYSRLYWLEKRDGKLVSTGKGAEKVYRLAAKTVKSILTDPGHEDAPESEVDVEPESEV
jgi:hypothetical protein